MRPRERRDSGQRDLLRSRLDQIVDLHHPLSKLAATIDWRFLEDRLGASYTDTPGRPPLPTRLMAGLAIIKHMHSLSDEALCERWLENPYYQLLCGEAIFLPPAAIRSLLADPLAPAHGGREAEGAVAGEPARRHPDGRRQARRLHPRYRRYDGAAKSDRLPDRCEAAAPRARAAGTAGTQARRQIAPVLHKARQDRADPPSALCACQAVQARQSNAADAAHPIGPGDPRYHAQDRRPVRSQTQRQRGPKIYSLHAPEVACIGKGKAHRPYEFGVKVSVATTLNRSKGGQFVAHVAALPGNPYDGHTLASVIPAITQQIGVSLTQVIADAGYRGHNAPSAPGLRVFTAGQKRGVTQTIKRALRRRATVEPVIGHLKAEHRMGRNYLATPAGDAVNAVLAAVGYNFRLLLAWLAVLLRWFLLALSGEPALRAVRS